jgi:exopolyphosphatase/guanosine-5'-triphosphate,3'-diphosphate pyrophosphatase
MLIADVGTGACQVSMYNCGELCFTETIRTGTLRILEEMPSAMSGPGMSQVLAPFVSKSFSELEHMSHDLSAKGLVAMGSSVRAFASLSGQLKPRQRVVRITRKTFNEMYIMAMKQSIEEMAGQYNINTEMAEAIVPCCLILDHLFKLTSAGELIVPMTSTKDALLIDYINETLNEKDYFSNQIISVVKRIAEKYMCLDSYTDNVVSYSERLFKKLTNLHGLGEKELFLLKLAGYLHKTGLFINNRAYHKHSLYLIMSSEIPGITNEERQIVALIARYHRKAFPKTSHLDYMSLSDRGKTVVNKLSAILRLACGFAGAFSVEKKFSVSVNEDEVVFKLENESDALMNSSYINQQSNLFSYVFAKQVIIG